MPTRRLLLMKLKKKNHRIRWQGVVMWQGVVTWQEGLMGKGVVVMTWQGGDMAGVG